MTVAIHLDPTASGLTPLPAAPANYIVSGWGRYVHMPRSLSVGAGRSVATFWCGPSAFMHDGRARWTDVVPEGLDVCGTCAGRRAGYHREGGLVFRPTLSLDDLTRFRWCPGPRLELYHAPNFSSRGKDWRDAMCLVCGHHGKLGCGGGAYHSSIHMRQHQPASARAIVICPSHGFRELRTANGDVWCGAWRCETTPVQREAR